MADERDCLYENVPVGSLPGGESAEMQRPGKSCGQARRPRPRPRRGAAPGKNPTGAGEPQAPVSPSSASAVPPSPTTLILAARPPCPPWHRTALRAGWAGNVVLLGAVILLVVLEVYLPLSQTRPPPAAPQTGRRSGSCESHQKTAACWEDFRACLKEHLCEEENGSAGVRTEYYARSESGVDRTERHVPRAEVDLGGWFPVKSNTTEGTGSGGRAQLCYSKEE